MLTKAQAAQLYEDIFREDGSQTVFELIQALTLTEKQRKQQEIAALFLSKAKLERKVKKYSRKERHHNKNKQMWDVLLEQKKDYAANLYELEAAELERDHYDWRDYNDNSESIASHYDEPYDDRDQDYGYGYDDDDYLMDLGYERNYSCEVDELHALVHDLERQLREARA